MVIPARRETSREGVSEEAKRKRTSKYEKNEGKKGRRATIYERYTRKKKSERKVRIHKVRETGIRAGTAQYRTNVKIRR